MDMPSSTSDSTLTSMSSTMMVFFTSTSTPLYSNGWTPSGSGQYAGTCIFLIVLAVIFRGLLSVKSTLERKWLHAEMNRRYIMDSGRVYVQERDSKKAIRGEDDNDNALVVTRNGISDMRPWRISTDGPRALLDTVIVGVGYLLMLAVMTMNVGYYMSILGGTFLGSLLLGRYATSSGHQG